MMSLSASPALAQPPGGPESNSGSPSAPPKFNSLRAGFISPLPTPTPSVAVTPPPTVEPTPPTLPLTETLGTVGPAGGRLASADGRVTVEFPVSAVDTSVEIQYLARRTTLVTPGQQGEALRFDLDAYMPDASGPPRAVSRFAQPVTLTVSLAGLIDLTQVPHGMRAYLAYLTPEGQWAQAWPLHVDRQAGTLSARVDHFSGWGAGVTTPNMWTLTYNPPHTDLFSGAATHKLAFQVPAGRNGLQPQLALSYSSRRMDGRVEKNDDGPVPDGWSLDVTDITRDRWWWCDWGTEGANGPCFADVFSLILNGTAYELYGGSGQKYGQYYAKDAPQLYIERRNDCSDDGGACNYGGGAPNWTGEYWIVRLPDGTEARLGYTENSEQTTNDICYPDYGVCHLMSVKGYRGRATNMAARRWRVDTMTDTFGNTMTFAYDEYKDGYAGNYNETRSTLRHISYNSGLSEIGFLGNGGSKPTITTIVMTNTNNSGVKVPVRRYELGRGQLVKFFSKKCEADPLAYTTLSSIQEFGQGGASFPTHQSFTYTLYRAWEFGCDAPMPRLTRVDNGYGGSTDIAYEWDQDTVGNRSYRVPGISSTGGVAGAGPAISTTYTYGPACYDRWVDDGSGHNTNGCASRSTLFAGGPSYYNPDPPKGPLVGHTVVTQTQRGAAGEVLATSVHQFYTDQSWRVGREWQTRQLDPLGALLQKQDTQWMSTTFGSGATFFVYAVAVTTTQDSKVSWTSYEYNPTQQGGAQYGNVTAEYYYGEAGAAGDERTVQRVYYPLTTTGWIVNNPARETVYPGLHTDNDQDIGGRTCYQYDGQTFGQSPIKGAVTTASRWKGAPGSSACGSSGSFVTTLTGYDTWGSPVVVTDALARAVRTEYDSQFHLYPVRVTNAREQSAVYDYDRARGLLLTATDPNSATTRYGYDAFGRLTSVTKPGDIEASPTLSYTYADGLAPWKIETRQRGAGTDTLDTAQYYDGLGRLLQTRSEAEIGQQAATRAVYDALGRKQIEYTPKFDGYSPNYNPNGWENQPRTTLQYDALGRTIVITAPDGTTTRTGNQGWTTTITDANGHRKDSIADAHGRLIAVKEYSGTAVYTTTYGYDTLGNLTRVTDTLSHSTVITYDALGRKTAMRDPDMGVWSYEYDAAGNLITQTDALGRQLVFGYDTLNRVTGKWSVESGVWKELTRYGYDQGTNGIGQRTAMTDATGVTAWAYDVRGRVVAETRSITTGLGVYTTSFTYDSADRVVAMTYPDGEVVTSGYNPAGLHYTLTSSLGEMYVSGATYDAAGQVTQMNLGNSGLVTNYDYDSQMHRLTAIRTWAGQSSVLSLTYAYDPVGNVKSITDTTNSGQVQRFDYDPFDRLTRGYTTGGDHGIYDERYTYDQIGNLTSKGPAGTPATYGYTDTAHIHAVTQLSGGPNGGSRFGYDANGNMILRVEVSGTQVMTYYQQFNAENRLTVVTATNGITQSVTHFAYDGDGARVLQITEAGTTIYIGDHYEEFLPGVQIPNLQAQISNALVSNLQPPTSDRQSLISDVQPPARGKTPGWASLARVSATAPTAPRTLTLPSLVTLAYPIGYDDDDSVWSYPNGSTSFTDTSGNAYGGSYQRTKYARLAVQAGMTNVAVRFGPAYGREHCNRDPDEDHPNEILVDGQIVWYTYDGLANWQEVNFSVSPATAHTVEVEPFWYSCPGGETPGPTLVLMPPRSVAPIRRRRPPRRPPPAHGVWAAGASRTPR